MSRTTTNVWTITLNRETYISVDERSFWTCVTDGFLSVHDCYVGRVLDDGHTESLGVPTERYKDFEELDNDRVGVSSNELERCFEDYCNIYQVRVRMRGTKGSCVFVVK